MASLSFFHKWISSYCYLLFKGIIIGASQVAQWLRVHLTMQGTWVRAPVREDPTCRGAAGPVSHGHWACASRACVLQRERPLTVVASPIAEHRLWMHRLSGHGSQDQLLHNMWDLPRSGHEPVCPASAGALSTTAPPGKPCLSFLVSFGLLEYF